jgi:hypothetical protein
VKWPRVPLRRGEKFSGLEIAACCREGTLTLDGASQPVNSWEWQSKRTHEICHIYYAYLLKPPAGCASAPRSSAWSPPFPGSRRMPAWLCCSSCRCAGGPPSAWPPWLGERLNHGGRSLSSAGGPLVHVSRGCWASCLS